MNFFEVLSSRPNLYRVVDPFAEGEGIGRRGKKMEGRKVEGNGVRNWVRNNLEEGREQEEGVQEKGEMKGVGGQGGR